METVVFSETINFSTSSLQTSQSGGIKEDPCNANTRSHPLRNRLAIPEGHRLGCCHLFHNRTKSKSSIAVSVMSTRSTTLCSHCCQHCALGGNQTACTDHHWCVFEGTHRESIRAATFLEFCAGNWAARLFTALAASVCSDGPQRLPVSQSSGAGSSVMERLSQHIWMSPCTKYWAVQCDPQVML